MTDFLTQTDHHLFLQTEEGKALWAESSRLGHLAEAQGRRTKQGRATWALRTAAFAKIAPACRAFRDRGHKA
tara:strand:+ start:872 stop:1087 length:216 start_codon:yes stop_codon:yes gene_type:complete